MEGEIFEVIGQLLAFIFEVVVECPNLLERKVFKWIFAILLLMILAGGGFLLYLHWR